MTTTGPAHGEAWTHRTAPSAAGRAGGPLPTWVRAHPVGAFLAWFFTVGSALSFIPLLTKRVFDIDLPDQLFIIASTVLGLLLPTVGITRLVDGPEGMRTLWRSIRTARVSLGWYALGLLLVPLVATALAFAFFGLPDVTASTLLAAIVMGLLVQTLVGFITNNLWEEVAWMGFVQARLQARHGALLAAALTAPLFALQHLALLVEENGPVGTIVALVAFAILATPFRAVIAWLYNRTASLFLVGFVHAAGNAATGGSGFSDGLLRRLYPDNGVGALHALAFFLIGLVVIAATRGWLGLPTGRTRVSRQEQ